MPSEERDAEMLGRLPERIARKLVMDERGCWIWTGSLTSSGYAQTTWERATRRVYRITYELLIGPISEGLEPDHLCRVRSCCNPMHLEPVTKHENMLRGISPAAQHARQTHCKRGHLFDEKNTQIRPQGWRACRACHNLKSKRRRDRKRMDAALGGGRNG